MPKPKLTPKQLAFCQEYLIDLNATQAAIRAGYSEKTAKQMATENLSKPALQGCIAELMAKRSERTELNADYVLRRLHEIESFNSDTMYTEDGMLKDVSEWPENAGRIISGIETSTVYRQGKDKDDPDFEVTTRKVKVESRTKALELMGKHVEIKAFDTTIKHEIVNAAEELSDAELGRIAAGRSKRVVDPETGETKSTRVH